MPTLFPPRALPSPFVFPLSISLLCAKWQSAFGTVGAAGGGSDGIDGNREDGDGVGAGGGIARQEVPHKRGHDRHPQGAARVEVRNNYHVLPSCLSVGEAGRRAPVKLENGQTII